MTGYLVLARCLSDDVPCGLFASQQEADGFAATLTMEMVQTIAGQAFNLDVSEVLNLTVVHMRGRALPATKSAHDLKDS